MKMFSDTFEEDAASEVGVLKMFVDGFSKMLRALPAGSASVGMFSLTSSLASSSLFSSFFGVFSAVAGGSRSASWNLPLMRSASACLDGNVLRGVV